MTINKVEQKIRYSISWYVGVQPRLDNVEHLPASQISINCKDYTYVFAEHPLDCPTDLESF